MSINVITILIIALPIIKAHICDKTKPTCEVTWEITHEQTMTHGKDGPVYPLNSKLYAYRTNKSVPADEVIVADGYENARIVIVVNKELPGPDLIVYEGQMLIINVINKLKSDSISVHWHGLPQEGFQWSDGVGFITQCPTLPGSTFQYNFTATPKGTYWYHSHVGFQRTEGFFGSLIIREKDSTMPEHILQVNSWNHDWDSIMAFEKLNSGFIENGTEFVGPKLPDGETLVKLKIHSILINGRARYYNPVSKKYNSPPLTVFNVTSGTKYRFRIINTDTAFPIKLSFDNHRVDLVASDGYDLESQSADAVITNPGERYDVIITANQTAGNYWIRAEILAKDKQPVGEAILHYDGTPMEDPSSNSIPCTRNRRCLHINCPFGIYSPDYYTDCIGFGSLKSAAGNDPAPVASGSNLKEVFLNFGFTDHGPAINEKSFTFPTVSALTQPGLVGPKCSEAGCGPDKPCSCVHTLEIKHNDIVQFVFINMRSHEPHPIHMHGYSYYVLKTGYSSQNTSTGLLTSPNPDIDCQNTTFCSKATWSNSSWLGGNVPNVEIQNAPRKDTLIIPHGGYAVLRIKANNPGVWFMHCHIEFHAVDGMAMMLNVTPSSSDQIPIPPDLPTCHGFPALDILPPESVPSSSITPQSDVPDHIWILVGILCFILLVLILAVIWLLRKMQKQKKGTNYGTGTHTTKHPNKSYDPSDN